MPLRATIRSMILQTMGALALSALLMFLPAGTFAWPQGWLFLALFFGLSQAMGPVAAADGSGAASVPLLTEDSQTGADLRVCADEKDRTDIDQRC